MIKSDKIANICLICEGFEEFDYLSKLINLGVWNNYSIYLDNAQSNGNLFARYQYNYQSDDYDLVLIVGDTDRPNYETYLKNKSKINAFHDSEEAANLVFIFGNPCTMQFMLQHFSNDPVFVKKANKAKNRQLIKDLTGIDHYNAHEEQREEFVSKISLDNYQTMKTNLKIINNQDDSKISSSNFLVLAENLEKSDVDWINKINAKLN